MSIGRRFANLVRSNLGSLLDRATDGSGGHSRLEDLSDAELEAELVRRRERREAAQRVASETSRGRAGGASSVEDQAWQEVEDAVRGGRARGGARGRRTSGARSRGRSRGTDVRLAQLYAQLECPYGADMDTVRKKYRAMMRKYHPDVHSRDAAKQRVATELSQRLTAAYNELRRRLERP